MIKYDIVCLDCGNTYESWFKSIEKYEYLEKQGLVQCSSCFGNNCKRGLSTPSIPPKLKKVPIRNVGENFANEARSMHYGEKEESPIIGTVNEETAHELIDEGIDFYVLKPEESN